MKRRLAAIFLAAAMVIVSGCSKTDQTTVTQEKESSKPETSALSEQTVPEKEGDGGNEETITAMIQNTWNKAAFQEVIDYVAEKTGIRMEVQVVPDGAQGEQVIKAKNASGEMTDILIYQPGAFFKMLNPEANFVDITDQKYTSAILEGNEVGFTDNGRLYGVPYVGFGSSMSAVFYNKSIFEKLKLNIPSNYDELLDICETLKNNGITPVYCSGKDAWTCQVPIYSAWSELAKGRENEILNSFLDHTSTFEKTPEFVEGMGMIQDLVERGYCNEDAAAASYENAQQAIADGSAAMYFAFSFITDNFYVDYSEKFDEIGAFPVPFKNGSSVCLLSPGGIYISKRSENLDRVHRWLECYVTPEAQDIYYETMMGIPMYKNVSKAKMYPVIEELYEHVKQGNYAMEAVAYFPVQFTDLEQISQSVAVGGVAPEEACKIMDENFARAMKLKGEEGW